MPHKCLGKIIGVKVIPSFDITPNTLTGLDIEKARLEYPLINSHAEMPENCITMVGKL